VGATGAGGPEFEAIATFATIETLPPGTWCLAYTELAGRGDGICPLGISGYVPSNLVVGPAPATGEMVSDLAADTSGSLGGADRAIVKVLNEVSGATLQECEVNSFNKNHCEKLAAGGHVPAFANIEVKIQTFGLGAYENQWRVRFRY